MPMRTIAGDCVVRYGGRQDRHLRGRVFVLVKPDDTVLVHDAEGYQPVAWLTRPAELSFTRDPLWLVAIDGDESLRVEADGDVTVAKHAVGPAGVPVGDCRCGGSLVRARGEVDCIECDDAYTLPSGAAVLDSQCDCGLPQFRVERGEAFELCLDRDCGTLLDAVRDAFDREWTCPECDGDLEILRRRSLLAGCENYPDCDTGYAIPDGVVVDDCDCGLPVFETASGRRCLDARCSTS